MLGLDGKQWLALIFWQFPDLVQLWALWDSQWMKLGDLDQPKLGHWHHICLAVSSARGDLSAAMNGLHMGSVSGKSIGNVPTKLDLLVGKWTTSGREEEQFHGSVTNVQVFASVQDTKELSRDPCSQNGDLLSWDPKSWTISGDSWKLQERGDKEVCEESKSYLVAFHIEMGIIAAMDLCKKKLGNGLIPSFEEAGSLQV